MNVGISSSLYQPFSPSQTPEERISSNTQIDNSGSVLKPVSPLAESAETKMTAVSQPLSEQKANTGQTESEQPREQQRETRQKKLEQQQIQQLAARDREVRNHERAHAAVGGQYTGAPRYQFERGPDGVNYAVSGEVSISTGSVNSDPQATIEKAQIIRRAALAPAEPSAQDRKVAAQATQMEARARVELTNMQREERLAEQEDGAQEGDKESKRTGAEELDGRTPATSSAEDKTESNPYYSSEQQKAFNQQLNALNRRIVSAQANGLYSEPGQLFNRIV